MKKRLLLLVVVFSAMSCSTPLVAGTSGPPDPAIRSTGCQEKKPSFFRTLFKGKNKSQNEVRGDGNVSSININGDSNVVTVNQSFVKKTTVVTPTIEKVVERPVVVCPEEEVTPQCTKHRPCPPTYAPYVPRVPCPPTYAPYVPRVPCPPEIKYVQVPSPPEIKYVQVPSPPQVKYVYVPSPPEIRYVQARPAPQPRCRQTYQPRPGCTPGYTTRVYNNGRTEVIPDAPGYGRNQYFASRY